MTRCLGFYRDFHSDWYINLPAWPGKPEEARVRSFSFLESIGEGRDWFRMDVSSNFLTDSRPLARVSEDLYVEHFTLLELHMCKALRYVFAEYPEVLYCKPIQYAYTGPVV